MQDCLFCKIVAGTIPSQIVHQDDDLIVFKDINPVAPHHLLVIPRKHIASVSELQDTELSGKLLQAAAEVADKLGFKEAGFRLVINTGSDGGQLVNHLHIHVLGGRELVWPPG